MESFLSLTDAVVQSIAEVLGVAVQRAPYRAGGEAVYELLVRSEVLDCMVTLILWPGLQRADVRLGDSSLVFKQINAVELYPGVEVLFRRFEPRGYLFLSVGGRISLVI